MFRCVKSITLQYYYKFELNSILKLKVVRVTYKRIQGTHWSRQSYLPYLNLNLLCYWNLFHNLLYDLANCPKFTCIIVTLQLYKGTPTS